MEQPKIIWPQLIFVVLGVIAIIVGLKLDKHFRKDYRISIWKGSMLLSLAVAVIVIPHMEFLQIHIYYPDVYARLVIGSVIAIAALFLYNTVRIRSLIG